MCWLRNLQRPKIFGSGRTLEPHRDLIWRHRSRQKCCFQIRMAAVLGTDQRRQSGSQQQLWDEFGAKQINTGKTEKQAVLTESLRSDGLYQTDLPLSLSLHHTLSLSAPPLIPLYLHAHTHTHAQAQHDNKLAKYVSKCEIMEAFSNICPVFSCAVSTQLGNWGSF